MGLSCRTLLSDNFVCHPCRTLLRGTLAVGRSCVTLTRTRTRVGHSCRKVLWDTLVGHSCSRFQPCKQHPLTRQSQCHSDIHLHHSSQPHDSLRLPQNNAPATKCDLATSRFPAPAQSPHKVLRLQRKVTISDHVSLRSPRHTLGMPSARSEHTPIHQSRHLS